MTTIYRSLFGERSALSRSILFAVGLLLVSAYPAQAQVPLGEENRFAFEFARPGRSTMTIYVWGSVGSPGIWQVERDVDLIALLSAARVPGIGQEEAETRQEVILSVYRGAEGQRQQVFEANLEDMVAEGAAYPSLQGEDILVVRTERKTRFSFRALSQYVGTLSTLVLLFLRLRSIG